jgi:hypothetical protein
VATPAGPVRLVMTLRVPRRGTQPVAVRVSRVAQRAGLGPEHARALAADIATRATRRLNASRRSAGVPWALGGALRWRAVAGPAAVRILPLFAYEVAARRGACGVSRVARFGYRLSVVWRGSGCNRLGRVR